MRKKKRRYFFPFRLFFIGLFLCIFYLGGRLVYGEIQRRKPHQEIIDLSGVPYDENFLKEISKTEDFYSVSPVYEIPVKLKWNEYTMDTVFTFLDFDEFQMTGTAPDEVETGNTPILLIGEKTLSGFSDMYGKPITENMVKKFWESEELPILEFATEGSGDMGKNTSGNLESNISQIWCSCLVAGCLTTPSEGIYVSLEQLSSITSELPAVNKALLTTSLIPG